MLIRPLFESEYPEAIKLKVCCWDEELSGMAPNRLRFNDELAFILNWVKSAEEYNDIRIVLGAFDNDSFVGFVGASIAEENDLENAMELNYLFVKKAYRGQGISLKLIDEVIQNYSIIGIKNMVVYNHHFAPSNNYYKSLGGTVIRQDEQGIDKLKIDIFSFDLNQLSDKIKSKLKSYN